MLSFQGQCHESFYLIYFTNHLSQSPISNFYLKICKDTCYARCSTWVIFRSVVTSFPWFALTRAVTLAVNLPPVSTNSGCKFFTDVSDTCGRQWHLRLPIHLKQNIPLNNHSVSVNCLSVMSQETCFYLKPVSSNFLVFKLIQNVPTRIVRGMWEGDFDDFWKNLGIKICMKLSFKGFLVSGPLHIY